MGKTDLWKTKKNLCDSKENNILALLLSASGDHETHLAHLNGMHLFVILSINNIVRQIQNIIHVSFVHMNMIVPFSALSDSQHDYLSCVLHVALTHHL